MHDAAWLLDTPCDEGFRVAFELPAPSNLPSITHRNSCGQSGSIEHFAGKSPTRHAWIWIQTRLYIFISLLYLLYLFLYSFIYLFIATHMRLYVTVVMYLHVSAMSVESRCFPQFLLRSLGGILGDSWGMRQSEAPNAKLTLRTFGGFEGFIWQSDRLWQIFAALHGTLNKLLMLLVHVISAISGPNDTAKAWDVIATQALASGRCFQPQDMRVSESSAHILMPLKHQKN